MNASLAYYKGFGLRQEHPAIHRWLTALEERPTYRGTQSDFHTHAHDLPPQMGGCYASGDATQRALAERIDQGPWPINGSEPGRIDEPSGGGTTGAPEEPVPWAGGERGSAALAPDKALVVDPETSQPEPPDAALVALGRVLKHRAQIVARNPLPPEVFEPALRCALTVLVVGAAAGPGTRGADAGAGAAWIPAPPANSAPGLRDLRDRISVPRDMPLHAARRLRQALEATALRDPANPRGQGTPIPVRHRLDQDPRPFLREGGANPN
jgi:glutathione S-transferase